MECPVRAERQVKLQQMSEEESHLFLRSLSGISPSEGVVRSGGGGGSVETRTMW